MADGSRERLELEPFNGASSRPWAGCGHGKRGCGWACFSAVMVRNLIACLSSRDVHMLEHALAGIDCARYGIPQLSILEMLLPIQLCDRPSGSENGGPT
jgi:hypothetical protein